MGSPHLNSWSWTSAKKENGNYYSKLGLYWDNGKENGNYYSKLGVILG